MAQSDLDIIVGADTRNLNKKVDSAVRRIERRGVNLDTKKGQLALGRITGKADEFTKSLEASNARVIAFGASVAVIEGVRRSFTKLVTTIVEVEQQLTSINSILGQSNNTINQFGSSLFDVAKQTGQSFQQVAQTAQEFARQGLSVEQTLQRTSDALILTRLTTLKTDEAVAALTATINGFQREALTSTEVINKLRAVETSFAVSSDDLASALARSASVAQGAGVSFDELLGVITAIKQRTGLGGATIGQGLKTVFTRLNLPTRVAELKNLNVEIDENANGFEKLRQVAIAYKAAQNANNQGLATQIGVVAAGQFQISKLSAAFDDLANSYSISDAAAERATLATNEANKANEQYNDTIAGVSKQISANIGAIFNSVGQKGTSDAIKNLVTNINSILEAFQGNKVSGSSAFVSILNDAIIGAKNFGFLRDAAEGFAKVLTGPGLVAAAAVIKNLFANTLAQGGKSLLSLTGVDKRQKNREQNQTAVLSLLRQGTAEEQKQFALATAQEANEKIILTILQRQLAVQQAQELQEIRTADAIRRKGLVISSTDAGVISTRRSMGAVLKGRGVAARAEGSIPDAIIREQNAIDRNVGGATSKARVQVIDKFNYGGGKRGPAVVNSDELIIPTKSGDIVLNKDMMNKKASNFAAGSAREIGIKGKLEAGQALSNKDKEWLRANAGNNPAGASNRFQNKILPATASAIIRGGGSNIYADNTIGAVRTARFQERNQARNPVGRPTNRESIRRRLISRGASGQFEALRSSSNPETRFEGMRVGGFAGFARRQDSLDRADALNQQARDMRVQQARDQKAQQIRAERRARQQTAFQEQEIFDSDQRARFRGDLDIDQNTRFSKREKAIFQDQAFDTEMDRELNRRGIKAGSGDAKKFANTPEGKKLSQNVKERVRTTVSNRFFEIDSQVADQQVKGAQLAIDKQARSGKLGKLGIPSFRGLEKQFAQDKTLTPLAKQRLQSDIQNRRLQRNESLSQKGFIGSFALSMASPLAGRVAKGVTGSERAGSAVEGGLQGAATGLALGAMFGPKGALVGGLGGLAFGAGSALLDKGPTRAEELKEIFENVREENVNSANAINSFLQSESLIGDLLSSGDFDTRKISRLRTDALKNLRQTNKEGERLLTDAQVSRITSARPEDRNEIAGELQRELTARTNIAGANAELAKILQQTTGSRLDFDDSAVSRLAQSQSGVTSFGGAFVAGSARTVRTATPFSELNRPGSVVDGKTLEQGGKQFQALISNILGRVDLGEFAKSAKAAEVPLSNFVKTLQDDLGSGNVDRISETFEKLGFNINDLDEEFRSTIGAVSGLGKALAASLGEGQIFSNLIQQNALQAARVSLTTNQARFGQAQLSAFQARRSFNDVIGLQSQLSTATGFNRRRSALEISGSKFGITDSQRDKNFLASQQLARDKADETTKVNRREIFTDAREQFEKFIAKPLSEGAEIDNDKLALTLIKLRDGIDDLTELKSIRNELKEIFKNTKDSKVILDGILLDTAKGIALENVAAADRKENIKINQNQETALRELKQSSERIAQIERELGQTIPSVLGTDDESIAGKVRAASGFTSTQGFNTVLQNEASQIREGLIAALQARGGDGEFLIPQFQQGAILNNFDRSIRSTRDSSQVSPFDVPGRANIALDSVATRFGSLVDNPAFAALRKEIDSRGGDIADIRTTLPGTLPQDFIAKREFFDRDGNPNPFVVPETPNIEAKSEQDPAVAESFKILKDEIVNTVSAFTGLRTEIESNDFLRAIVERISEGIGSNQLVGEKLQETISLLQDYLNITRDGNTSASTRTALEQNVFPENYQMNPLPLGSESTPLDMGILVEKLGGEIDPLAEAVNTLSTNINAGIETRLETNNIFTINFEGLEQNFANTQDLIDELSFRLDKIESELRGDVITPD